MTKIDEFNATPEARAPRMILDHIGGIGSGRQVPRGMAVEGASIWTIGPARGTMQGGVGVSLDSAQNRSKNSSRIGVVFVHGVGAAAHSDTLIAFGQAFVGWVARWQQARGRQSVYGEAALNFTPYDAGSDHPIPYAELRMPAGPDDPVAPTWVCAEAWWASSVRPLPFTTMVAWSFRYLWSLLAQLILGLGHRMSRLWPSNQSIHDGNYGYLLVDVLTSAAHITAYVLVGMTGYAVLLPIMAAAQIPYPPLQNFIVVTVFRVFLQFNASELLVYYEDEIQAANMRRRVAEAVAWLTRPAAEGGGDCESVTIVAHSGGAWVAHGMLSDDTYSWLRKRVRKFITLGCGLNKIWELAPSTLERLHKPIEGNIYWLDFWGSYDPVPAGWMTPPRIGRRSLRSFLHLEPDSRPWQCIYKPDPLLARRHNMQPRSDALPPLELANPSGARVSPSLPQPAAVQLYWPDSVRVINRMDALTDHGGYFTNDEEVLRRVAAEIQADIYTDSIFWGPPAAMLQDAIRARRSRVGVLAAARLLGLIGGAFAAKYLGGSVAEYISSIGPIASLLSAAREVLLFLIRAAGVIETVPSIAAWPVIGGGWSRLVAVVVWLPSAWIWLVVVLLWVAGAAIASLLGLIPYEVCRALWETHDQAERQGLLRRALPAFQSFRKKYGRWRHTVYKTGTGPAVIVMHEFPGITPAVEAFALKVAGAGFTVYVPWLFGDVNDHGGLGYQLHSAAAACVSREFVLFARGRTSPVADWLRRFANTVFEECDGLGVGVIGLCFSGNFALATATDKSVLAPVVSEPALPFPIWPWDREKTAADIGLSPTDLSQLQARMSGLDPLPVLGFRFTCDHLSPKARFATLRAVLGANFVGCEIPSDPGNEWHIPQAAHSVLTADRVDTDGHPTAKALKSVLEFLEVRLKPPQPARSGDLIGL